MSQNWIRLILIPVFFFSLHSCSTTSPRRDLKKIKSLGLLLTGFDSPNFYYGTLDQPIGVASLAGVSIETQGEKQELREFKAPEGIASLKKRFKEMLTLEYQRKVGDIEVIEGTSAPFSWKAEFSENGKSARKIDVHALRFAHSVDAVLVVTPEAACSDRKWSIHPQSIISAEFPFSKGSAVQKSGHTFSNVFWCAKTYLFSGDTGQERGSFSSAYQRQADFGHDLSPPHGFLASDLKKFKTASDSLMDAYFNNFFSALF